MRTLWWAKPMRALELRRTPIKLVNSALLSPTATPLTPDVRASLEALSPREYVVLCNLSEDLTLVEIAAVLWVSHNTIKSQVRSVYRKIGVATRAEAVAWALTAGLPQV